MATFFLSIMAQQRPFPIGEDVKGRSMFSVNFLAQAEAPVADFGGCIIKVLVDAGLVVDGGANPTVFEGPDVEVPDGAGPFVLIIPTGGPPPMDTHDGKRYDWLSVMLNVRGSSYVAAQNKALACYEALHGIFNETIAA